MAVCITFDVASLKVVDVDSDGAFGWSKKELLALDAFALFPRWWNAGKTAEVPVMTFVRPKSGPLVPVTIAFERNDPFLRATITPREALSEAEKELEATNAYLHAIVENIPDMIFVKDAKTHAFKRFNRAGEELLGFTRGELLGKTDHDFYPKEQADFFHQKDDETMRAGTIVDIPQEPILTKYKGERVLHTRKIPVYDTDGNPQYLLGISEDITERIKAEQMARELADIVRFARDAVVSFTADGTIVAWNPSAERLYGVPADRAIGMSFLRFVPDDERARFEKRIRTLAEPSVSEVVRIRADGAEIQVEESMFVVQNRIATMARDLTELSRWREAAQRLGTRAGISSPAMDAVLQEADLVAQNADATVLLLGETGVGKSHVARRIHQKSARAERPFFEVNCAGLGRDLVESELFGHERGAFTGAVSQKRGLVETAEGGTLFLDEVGELPMLVQAQLLTFLDSHTFRRVGGTRTMHANVRLLAATNVELKSAVAEGRFRSDLFYRLSVVPLTIPPLRERREDIAALAGSLLADLSRRLGKHVSIDRKAEDALERYRWPGNIRELRNALERALILSRGERITIDHLPADIRSPQPAADSGRSLDTREREHILEVLKETGGNRTKAAELLGISRSTLKRKLAEMRR